MAADALAPYVARASPAVLLFTHRRACGRSCSYQLTYVHEGCITGIGIVSVPVKPN